MTHVPKVIFKTRVRNDALGGLNPFEWKDLSSDEIFVIEFVIGFHFSNVKAVCPP